MSILFKSIISTVTLLNLIKEFGIVDKLKNSGSEIIQRIVIMLNDELISDTQRYKCLGNAVTTTVISYLIDEMFKGVFDDEDEESD